MTNQRDPEWMTPALKKRIVIMDLVVLPATILIWGAILFDWVRKRA